MDAFTWDPRARPATDFTGNTGAGRSVGRDAAVPLDAESAGTALSYLTAPLTSNVVVVGAGALHAWIEASTPRRRPPGDGLRGPSRRQWRRSCRAGGCGASERKLDRAASTLLEPVLSLRSADAAPLPRGRFTEVAIPLYYEGHVYRAGSRIRITISAPGGDQPTWAFADLAPGAVGGRRCGWPTRASMPSRLVLPVVPGVDVPDRVAAVSGAARRAVPALRAAGQPDRSAEPEPAQSIEQALEDARDAGRRRWPR